MKVCELEKVVLVLYCSQLMLDLFYAFNQTKKMKKRGCSNHITSWATQDTEVAF